MTANTPYDGAAFVRRLQRLAPARPRLPTWVRLALLALILGGFLRVMWGVDDQDLWWDESLSLQRAESAWSDLLIGRLPIRDGITQFDTIDQHPFFLFVLQGLLLRLAGDGEAVLRFPSVMAATLLIPMVWVVARRLVHAAIVPDGAPLWAALLAAAHPFFHWYGQEARPYALWAMLALLSTYCLWRALQYKHWPWRAGFILTAAMFYTTHYYALFLLPVHALLIAQRLWARSRRWALAVVIASGLSGVTVSLAAYWLIIVRQGGGGNFATVRWRVLLPDLLNAFSMGPSADLEQFWWLDVLSGLIALVGVGVALRSRRAILAGGWLLPALVGIPVLALLLVGQIIPAYMTARHMSLIGGGYILLVATGLAFLARRGRYGAVASGLLAAVLLAGMAVSSHRYLTVEDYAKDDFTGLGAYLARRLAPGDLLLYQSPFAWRVLTYYTPLDTVWRAQHAGVPIAAYGVPLIDRDWDARETQLRAWSMQYRRIWYVLSNTHPDMDLEGRTEQWLRDNLFLVESYDYFSTTILRRGLYLREVPVDLDGPPAHAPVFDAHFGAQIQVDSLFVDPAGAAPVDGLALPITIYWRASEFNPDRYKYILQLEEGSPADPISPPRVLARTEREPYDGAIPTLYWDPGKSIVEFTELPPSAWPRPSELDDPNRYTITLQVYHADTLEKLPVTIVDAGDSGADVSADGLTLRLPFARMAGR